VCVDFCDSDLLLDISDNGHPERTRGSPDADPDSDRAGHGLVGMRARVAMLGGTLSAGRDPGGGFRVRVRLPAPGGPAPEPAVTQPTVTQPTVTQPTVTQPTVTELTVPQPAVTQPTVTEPTVPQPTVTELTVPQPAVTKPAVPLPAATEPTATQRGGP